MKKLFVLLLAFSLLCAMAIPAFADSPITAIGGSDTATVTGSYVSGSSSTVYSVDISWGSMAFTYVDASQGSWNPATHEYDDAVEAHWSCDEGDNTVTVTNHSNAAVRATLAYTPAAGYTAIQGSFSNATLDLVTAVGTERTNAPTASATLTLTGALPAGTNNVTIGTVTITLGNQ